MVTTPVRLWQNVVQPLSVPLVALGLVVGGFALVAARREHGREKSTHHDEGQKDMTATDAAPPTLAAQASKPEGE